MQQPVARAWGLATALLLAGPAVTEQLVQLSPCSTLGRLGTVDENGVVTRPATPQQLAANMTRYCSYVVLGRFVSVSDSHYDELSDPPEEPVVATFQVAEVLRGKAFATASIRLARHLLVAPGKDASRHLDSQEATADRLYRDDLANELTRDLKSVLDAGMPLTPRQHERSIDAVERMVRVPPRTRYERHRIAKRGIWTTSPLSFETELGAIRPDDLFLLGLSDQQTESPQGRFFRSLHTDLFWGQEALDIAAALREQSESTHAPQP